jgi:hypothetical protein
MSEYTTVGTSSEYTPTITIHYGRINMNQLPNKFSPGLTYLMYKDSDGSLKRAKFVFDETLGENTYTIYNSFHPYSYNMCTPNSNDYTVLSYGISDTSTRLRNLQASMIVNVDNN